MQLVYCQKCHQPIGKAAPGSKVEIPCRRCAGLKTYAEIPADPGPRLGEAYAEFGR